MSWQCMQIGCALKPAVQMSLDTKRAEIRKLEERALQREEALKKSEQMLEEDALRQAGLV